MNRIAVDVSPVPPARALDPATIDFGKHCTPHMFVADHRGGEWRDARVVDLLEFSLNHVSTALLSFQFIVQSLKAYRQGDQVVLFRPEENARLFMRSAVRMGMPAVPESLFLEAIETLVDLERAWIP